MNGEELLNLIPKFFPPDSSKILVVTAFLHNNSDLFYKLYIQAVEDVKPDFAE